MRADVFAFLASLVVPHDARRSVGARCRRYGVSRAGFYRARQRGPSAHTEQDQQLAREIARLFALHQERYGSPRIHHLLRAAGCVMSRRRVARLTRAAGLQAAAAAMQGDAGTARRLADPDEHEE